MANSMNSNMSNSMPKGSMQNPHNMQNSHNMQNPHNLAKNNIKTDENMSKINGKININSKNGQNNQKAGNNQKGANTQGAKIQGANNSQLSHLQQPEQIPLCAMMRPSANHCQVQSGFSKISYFCKNIFHVWESYLR